MALRLLDRRGLEAWRTASTTPFVQTAVADGPVISVVELQNRLGIIEGVNGVHDLHVWTLTSEMEVASLHLITPANAHRILDQATSLVRDEYGINSPRHPPSQTRNPPEL